MTVPWLGTPRSMVAWAGGVLFAVALSWCFGAILFGMPQDRSATDSALTRVVINLALFAVFAGHHSMFARTAIKRLVTTYVPPELERSLYVWIASLLLMVVCVLWRPLPGAAYAHHGVLAAVHWTIVLAGFWVTFRSAGVLDPLELAGIRQAVGETRAPVFKIVGPYHVVRHPIYFGWLLIVFGVPEMTWTRFEFALVSSAYLVLAIPIEERSLVDAFGDTYRAYQRHVRWRLVPWIW